MFLVSDNLILRLAKAAGEVLGKTHDELMYAFGVYMVKRIGNYGYERILKVISRATPHTVLVTFSIFKFEATVTLSTPGAIFDSLIFFIGLYFIHLPTGGSVVGGV